MQKLNSDFRIICLYRYTFFILFLCILLILPIEADSNLNNPALIASKSDDFYVSQLRNTTPLLPSPFPAYKVNDFSYENHEPHSEEDIPRSPLFIPLPHLDTAVQYDVVINDSFPRAMELNASSMKFLLNFTIVDSIGAARGVLRSLVVSNTTHNLRISDSDIYDWNFMPTTDDYSLRFNLNN